MRLLNAPERSATQCEASLERAIVSTLISARDDHEVQTYVVTPGQGSNSHAVTSLCSTLGAKATPVEESDERLLNFAATPSVSFLVARPASTASFATQSGGEQNEVAILLSRLMQPGSWVAISLRAPSKSEIKRVRRWFDYRREASSVAHYTNNPNTLVATLYAGGTTDEEVATLLTQVMSVVPGFDIEAIPFSQAARFSPRLAPLAGIVTGVISSMASHKPTVGLVRDSLRLSSRSLSRRFRRRGCGPTGHFAHLARRGSYPNRPTVSCRRADQ